MIEETLLLQDYHCHYDHLIYVNDTPPNGRHGLLSRCSVTALGIPGRQCGVGNWLQRLGVGQYAQRFTENDIEFSILHGLPDQDLEKVGVALLGHRGKLLQAIAELKGVGNDASEITAAAAPVAPRQRRLPSSARGREPCGSYIPRRTTVAREGLMLGFRRTRDKS